MNNADKMMLYRQLYSKQSNSVNEFNAVLKETEDIKYNYVDYMTTHPVDCDIELVSLPLADYDICCALLTMFLREDYFCNGSFEKRCIKGQVGLVLERMIELLSNDDATKEICETKENAMKFGKLEEVKVRDLWKHEQYDFSSWLAKEENMEELGDTIGLNLVDVNTEVYVGSYRCDLVAKDETTGIKVIIENQLEPTNHDHLGKIITYASGLDAKVVVWIVGNAREEHRSAIEWLNNNTVSDIAFFLIEIHAYKIGDSLPAPKFEVIEKPNDFLKNTKGRNSNEELNKSQSERLEFWTQFNDVVVEKGKPFSVRKPTTDHWYDVAIGTSEAHISITLINKSNKAGVELYINDNKELFDILFEKKKEIEEKAGLKFSWERLDSKKASRIIHNISGLNFDDHSNYLELMEDIIDKVVIMRDVFKEYMK